MDIISRDLEAICNRSPAGLRQIADALPVAKARKGATRRFSMGDAVLILIAVELETRGFAPRAARHLASALAPHLAEIIATEPMRLVVTWSADNEPGIDLAIVGSKDEAAAVLDSQGWNACATFDATRLVREAMQQLLAATKDARYVR